MADYAWACRVTQANRAAIASEDPKFDRKTFEAWLNGQESNGYFIRDPNSPFDCKYMADGVFSQIYKFDSGDSAVLFRRVTRIA